MNCSVFQTVPGHPTASPAAWFPGARTGSWLLCARDKTEELRICSEVYGAFPCQLSTSLEMQMWHQTLPSPSHIYKGGHPLQSYPLAKDVCFVGCLMSQC